MFFFLSGSPTLCLPASNRTTLANPSCSPFLSRRSASICESRQQNSVRGIFFAIKHWICKYFSVSGHQMWQLYIALVCMDGANTYIHTFGCIFWSSLCFAIILYTCSISAITKNCQIVCASCWMMPVTTHSLVAKRRG